MNGRIYDAKLGRFLQADPIVQAPKNSQSLNRYSYVLNNPLSYTDPSGFFSDPVTASIIASILNTLFNKISHGIGRELQAQNNTFPIPETAIPGTVKSAFGNGPVTNVKNVPTDVSTTAAIIGGTTSDATGGKFANGGATKSFAEADSGSKLDNFQLGLDVAGLTPVFGIFADVLNTIISVARGDFANAGLNAVAIVPIIGQGATGAKLIAKGADEATGFLGSRRLQLKNAPFQKVRNTPTVINGRVFSGHALDQMQNRGITPRVVENAIRTGARSVGKTPSSSVFVDGVNKLRVVINSETGNVITVIPGVK